MLLLVGKLLLLLIFICCVDACCCEAVRLNNQILTFQRCYKLWELTNGHPEGLCEEVLKLIGDLDAAEVTWG